MTFDNGIMIILNILLIISSANLPMFCRANGEESGESGEKAFWISSLEDVVSESADCSLQLQYTACNQSCSWQSENSLQHSSSFQIAACIKETEPEKCCAQEFNQLS